MASPESFAQTRREYVVTDIEWDKLLKSIYEQRCVLFLGPDLLPDIHVFDALCKHLNVGNNPNVRMAFPADELFLFPDPRARKAAGEEIEMFFEENQERFKPFYEKIAALPFHLVLSALPDMSMTRAFDELGIAHQFSYYNRRKVEPDFPYDAISADPKDCRLVFNLFGRSGKLNSLVLSHDDLFDYFKSILGAKGLSHEDYQRLNYALADATNFLFLGFSFGKWYMQLLLRLLNPEQDISRQYALNPELADETMVYYGSQFKIKFVDGYTPAGFLDELGSRWQTFIQPFEEHAPLKQRLLNQHKQGLLLKILEQLDAHAKTLSDNTLGETVAMLFQRYNTLQNQIKFNVIKPEDAAIERNKIALALLELIRECFD